MVWALIAACALWAVARLAGADRSGALAAPLVAVLAFTPYAGALCIVATLAAAARRRWAACAAAAVVAGAFAAAVVPRATGGPAPRAGGPALRVLTVNMRFGQADPHVIAGLVRRLHVDVLCLEEFTKGAAAALGAAGLGALLPRRVAAPIGGAAGSALYTRYPLRSLPMPRVDTVGLAMPRALLAVPGGPPVEVMVVHMAHPLGRSGVAKWARGLAAVPRPGGHGPVRVVAGDFNGTLDDARVRGLLSSGYRDAAGEYGAGLAPTFRASPWPPITIDHVMADARCAVRRAAVYRMPRSDHRAVFAELSLPRRANRP